MVRTLEIKFCINMEIRISISFDMQLTNGVHVKTGSNVTNATACRHTCTHPPSCTPGHEMVVSRDSSVVRALDS